MVIVTMIFFHWFLLFFFLSYDNYSILQFGSHSKKRPNNLVLGRTFDHHIYDLVEVGVENFKPMSSFSFDQKIAPKVGSKPFIVFIGEGFETVDELRHLKEVLLDLFREEVCTFFYCFFFHQVSRMAHKKIFLFV